MAEHDQSSRRHFLQRLGWSSGAVLLLKATGCSGTEGDGIRGTPAPAADTSRDGGIADASSPDATSPVLDAASPAHDTAAGLGDAGADLPDAQPGSCAPTHADAKGPFHIEGSPQRTRLAGPQEPGERIAIEGRVLDERCRPVAGALLDIWQADAGGEYHGAAGQEEYRLRGQMMSAADGSYRFETILPGRYPLGGSTRPAHIHFTVSKPGFGPVTTQMYFEGDPFLAPNDPCTAGCHSGDPARIVALQNAGADGLRRGNFDITLGAG